MFLSLFNREKAAEAVAYLLLRANGSLEILKLMKLTYLAERRSYEQYGEPLTGDVPFSLEHGPVLSNTFNFARVGAPERSESWDALIRPSTDKHVRLVDVAAVTEDDLLNLSDSDLDILREIWDEFGHMSGTELRTYTHTLPEYEEQQAGKAKHIEPVKMLKAVGFSEAEARKHVSNFTSANRVKAAFAAAL